MPDHSSLNTEDDYKEHHRPHLIAKRLEQGPDSVYLKDHIQTEKDSHVQILFDDESLLILSENTMIQITEYICSPEENRRSVVIQVLIGRVRGVVGRYLTGPGSKYIISTPTDTIKVEHGHFVVDAAEGRIQ